MICENGEIWQLSAGTTQPIWASSAAVETVRMNVDLPDMLLPIRQSNWLRLKSSGTHCCYVARGWTAFCRLMNGFESSITTGVHHVSCGYFAGND